MFNKMIDLDEVKQFIDSCGPETKVFVGADSEKAKIDGIWYADYITVIVVHVDGKHGCKIFGQVVRERDYDQVKNKPRMRLVNEAYKAAEMYLALAPMIPEMDIEVHIDLNPNEKYASSIAVQEAVGYIRGVCGVDPKTKPFAVAASYAADRYRTYMN